MTLNLNMMIHKAQISKKQSVTFCDMISFEETVSGYQDHQIQSLPATS